MIELKYSKGNHVFSVYITWRLREKVWVNGVKGGGGGGWLHTSIFSLREIYLFLRLCGIMLWNTKSEIGLQQYDYEIRR